MLSGNTCLQVLGVSLQKLRLGRYDSLSRNHEGSFADHSGKLGKSPEMYLVNNGSPVF